MEEFVAALAHVKDLHAEVKNAKNERFLIRSTADPSGAWVLTCTDFTEHYWEKEFRFEEAAKIKAASDVNDGWEPYFKRFAEAFLAENIFVQESPALCTVTTWSFVYGKQQSYVLKLPPVTKDTKKKIADFASNLFSHLKRLRNVEHELRVAQKEIRSLREEVEQARDVGGGGGGDVARGNVARSKKSQAKTPAVKRKPHMSLVNPAVKRHIPKGARIATDDPSMT